LKPNTSITQFIHGLLWEDIPKSIQHMASRCVMDLCGILIAGTDTELSRIIYNVVRATYGGDDSTLPMDGRRVSAAGAALAMGMSIDA
jgi:2-methylcitrate dehydratase PrpD